MDLLGHILHRRNLFRTYHLCEELYRSWGQYLCIQKYSQPRNDYSEVNFSARLGVSLNLLRSIATPAVLLRECQPMSSIRFNVSPTEQHPPVYTLLFGSQIVLPWAGPQVPSVENTGPSLASSSGSAGRNDIEYLISWTGTQLHCVRSRPPRSRIDKTHSPLSVHHCPRRQPWYICVLVWLHCSGT